MSGTLVHTIQVQDKVFRRDDNTELDTILVGCVHKEDWEDIPCVDGKSVTCSRIMCVSTSGGHMSLQHKSSVGVDTLD